MAECYMTIYFYQLAELKGNISVTAVLLFRKVSLRKRLES